MKRLRGALAALALFAGGGIDFEAVASAFRERHDIVGGSAPEAELDHVLATSFVQVRLGLLDVHFPLAALADKAEGARLQTVCRALLQAQGRWLDLVEPLGVELDSARRDLKALDAWVKGWNPSILRGAADADTHDLYVLTEAKDKVRETGARFAATMSAGVGLPKTRSDPHFTRLVLLPTRREFVELVCFAGWLYPADQGKFWLDDAAVWLECRVVETRLLALQSADPLHPDDWTAGMALDKRERTGLEQHVVQRGFYALMANYFGEDVNQAFTSALAMAVVIDLFEEDNTRFEGDLRGHSEPDTEMFVPGGNAAGGILPSADLESRFRESKGADYFVRSLRQAQKQGADNARSPRDKLASFLLVADDKVERYSIAAPFLGSAAKGIVPPAERFVSDYKELYRAYKTCFVHWLRTAAGDSSADSAARFARLLAGLVDRSTGGEESFEPLFPEIYDGAVLSETELGEGSLEGRFLRWLQRQG